MARSKDTLLLFFVISLFVVFGVYYTWNRTYDSKNYKETPESYMHSQQMMKKESSDMELIPPSDDNSFSGDDFQLLDVADEDPAFQIGFGMGPGLYGSGRHTSEMIGN